MKAFVALVIVAAFAAWPFLLVWLFGNGTRTSDITGALLSLVYLVCFCAMVGTVHKDIKE